MAELYPAEDLYPGESLYPGEGVDDAPPRIAVGQEFPSDQLAARIEPPRGAPSRWAADEPLAENVIDDVRCMDEMPGGDKEFTGTLGRDPRTPWSDLAPYSNVGVYGPGGEEVGCYRLDKAPEIDGDRAAIDPAAVGWSRALDDNKSLVGPGFIDGDLSKWGTPSSARRLALIKAAIRLVASTSVGTSPKNPEDIRAAIINDFSGVVTLEAPDTEAGEAHYSSGGVDVGEIRYDNLGDLAGGGASANWESNIALGTTDTFGTAAVGTDHDAASATNKTVVAPAPGYHFARIRNWLNTAAEGSELKRVFAWSPKVIGRHGLTPQGTWPDIGFTAKQMLAYAIPLYTSLTFDEESDDDGFIIPQAWFAEPGPMSQVVQELTKYGLLDWFVFGDRKFKMRFPGTYGRRWQAYSGPSGLQEAGMDGERLWESILVRWQDVDGSSRTAGAPGSGAMFEDPTLQIQDPDHPAVKAREAYGPNFVRQDLLDLRGISTEARAIEAGERWLAEANLLNRSGSCTLSGYVMDDRGVWYPVSRVRAGDLIRFPDAADTSYRRIVGRDYSHPQRSVSCALDAPKDGMAALLERLQAEIFRLQI